MKGAENRRLLRSSSSSSSTWALLQLGFSKSICTQPLCSTALFMYTHIHTGIVLHAGSVLLYLAREAHRVSVERIVSHFSLFLRCPGFLFGLLLLLLPLGREERLSFGAETGGTSTTTMAAAFSPLARFVSPARGHLFDVAGLSRGGKGGGGGGWRSGG